MSLSLQNLYHVPTLNMRNIVVYTFLDVCEKIHQFLSGIRKMHTKENWFVFFCLTVYICLYDDF